MGLCVLIFPGMLIVPFETDRMFFIIQAFNQSMISMLGLDTIQYQFYQTKKWDFEFYTVSNLSFSTDCLHLEIGLYQQL